MALGRGLGEILNEVEEAYERDLASVSDINDKKVALNVILEILEIHGSAFILEILKTNDILLKKSQQVQMYYNRLRDEFPNKKAYDLRNVTAEYFGISDKAVQKHIYKGRNK